MNRDGVAIAVHIVLARITGFSAITEYPSLNIKHITITKLHTDPTRQFCDVSSPFSPTVVEVQKTWSNERAARKFASQAHLPALQTMIKKCRHRVGVCLCSYDSYCCCCVAAGPSAIYSHIHNINTGESHIHTHNTFSHHYSPVWTDFRTSANAYNSMNICPIPILISGTIIHYCLLQSPENRFGITGLFIE